MFTNKALHIIREALEAYIATLPGGEGRLDYLKVAWKVESEIEKLQTPQVKVNPADYAFHFEHSGERD
jgi:hypothetical protein